MNGENRREKIYTNNIQKIKARKVATKKEKEITIFFIHSCFCWISRSTRKFKNIILFYSFRYKNKIVWQLKVTCMQCVYVCVQFKRITIDDAMCTKIYSFVSRTSSHTQTDIHYFYAVVSEASRKQTNVFCHRKRKRGKQALKKNGNKGRHKSYEIECLILFLFLFFFLISMNTVYECISIVRSLLHVFLHFSQLFNGK